MVGPIPKPRRQDVRHVGYGKPRGTTRGNPHIDLDKESLKYQGNQELLGILDQDDPAVIQTLIQDTDGDTKVQTEETTDEDVIRFDTQGTERMRILNDGTVEIVGDFKPLGRVLTAYGEDVASAANITLGDGKHFNITGTTQIDTINSTGWVAGSEVTLHFGASVTVKHNTSGSGAEILLAGGLDFAATAGDNLTLVLNSTGDWEEISRTVI
jgi:hypothetical protein